MDHQKPQSSHSSSTSADLFFRLASNRLLAYYQPFYRVHTFDIGLDHAQLVSETNFTLVVDAESDAKYRLALLVDAVFSIPDQLIYFFFFGGFFESLSRAKIYTPPPININTTTVATQKGQLCLLTKSARTAVTP